MKLWAIRLAETDKARRAHYSSDRRILAIIRAETEQQARELWAKAPQWEYRYAPTYLGDREMFTCTDITADGPAAILMIQDPNEEPPEFSMR